MAHGSTRLRRALALLALALALLALVGCVPSSPPAQARASQSVNVPPPAPAPRTDMARWLSDGRLHPTLVEYVDTLDVYAHPGDVAAVNALVEDVFSVANPGYAIPCLERGIIPRESTDVWSAHNPSGATGLTQLLGWEGRAAGLTGSGDVFNPWVNLVTARDISSMGTNMGPWTPKPRPC